jgi:hypothetical protein
MIFTVSDSLWCTALQKGITPYPKTKAHLLELGTLKVLYTMSAAAKLPMAFATSLAPWEKAIAHALMTWSTCGK